VDENGENAVKRLVLHSSPRMKKLTVANYTKDQLYPAVARAMAEILRSSNAVAPVDLLLHMQRITKKQHEDWRFGRIAYLERVCLGGLGKLSRILRILELHARKLNLTPSQTVYHKWGQGGKRITLRFSKSGEPNLEAAYSRHYVKTTARVSIDPSGPAGDTGREAC
jgi:hypothetical protein